MTDLRGTNAIVTGGAVRIGRAIALALAEAGANVCVHYGTSAEAANEVVAEIAARGVCGTAVSADLRRPVEAAGTIVEHATSELGPVSLLVNSAAIFEAGTLASIDESHFDRHVDVNLKAPLFLARAFAERAPEDRENGLVNILDWRALRPPPGHLVYTMTKAALAAATRMLAVELAPRIRVNGIAPGAILPPPGADREPWEREKSADVPLQRVGTPEDIAGAVLYLVRSRFVNGEILHVTGGEQFSS